ncbi:MAG: hypothetical protein K2X87_14190 [Gemmataceae bacterium]|nr:hypothetical protein [Gemmataceae bacterium]
MTPTAAPAVPPARAGETADPRQLAADLERAVLPLPPAERRAILARLVALTPDPPANGHPGPAQPPQDYLPPAEQARIVAELNELEARSPAFDRGEVNADWAWMWREQSRGPGGELGPYGGKHVAIYRGRVIGSDEASSLRLQLRASQTLRPPVHPNRLVVVYVEPWDHAEG